MTPAARIASDRQGPFAQIEPECADCPVLKLFLPGGLGLEETKHFNRAIHHNRPMRRDEYLFSIGSTSEFLYAIRRGFMKSQIKRADGSERILGFHMPGDLIGMDGTPTGKHGCDAIALENTSVCQISYLDLEELTSVMPNLEQLLARIIRREVVRLYGNMLAFNEMGPGERLALFLVTLSTRYVARGYSQTRFKLHMPHQDIANHLGLTLETLSRQFSRLEDTRVIALQDGWVKIKAPGRLAKIIENNIARRDPRQSA